MDGNNNGGIVASGNDSTVINNDITVGGTGSKGIAAFGNHSTLANHGDIIVTGQAATPFTASATVWCLMEPNLFSISGPMLSSGCATGCVPRALTAEGCPRPFSMA